MNRLKISGPLPIGKAVRLLPEIPLYLFHRMLRDGLSCRPLVITIELTYRCHLDCPYCFLQGSGKTVEELPLSQIEELLESFKGYRPVIHLTGGEPFLRSDLPEIIASIRARGHYCAINTTGGLISKKNTPWLERIRPDRFAVSLHGREEEHDRFCSCRGAFDKTVGGIRYLGELGLLRQVSINTVLTSFNQERMADFMGMVKQLGVGSISFQHGMPTNKEFAARKRGEGGNLLNTGFGMINPGRMSKTVKTIRRMARVLRLRVRFIPELNSDEIIQWYTVGFTRLCRYPYFASRIDPAGNVYPCHRFHLSFGNIKDTSLLEIWNGDGYRRFRDRIRRSPFEPECLNCCKV